MAALPAAALPFGPPNNRPNILVYRGDGSDWLRLTGEIEGFVRARADSSVGIIGRYNITNPPIDLTASRQELVVDADVLNPGCSRVSFLFILERL